MRPDAPQSAIDNSPPKLILASASPRRRELLALLTEAFEIFPSGLEEPEFDDPWATAERLALDKALHVSTANPEAVVVGADTVVAFEEEGWKLLSKPNDEAEARRMLRSLSGRSHLVVTGVAVVGNEGREVFSDTTTVTFRGLSDAEIADYVATGEPMDKAGAYAIQGGARGFVERIEGSWSNVVGLPLERLAPILSRRLGLPELEFRVVPTAW